MRAALACASAFLWAHAELALNGVALGSVLLQTLALRPPFPTSSDPLPLTSSVLSLAAKRAARSRSTLSARALSKFQSHGFVHLPAALPADVTAALRAALDTHPPRAPPLLASSVAYALQRADTSYLALGQVRLTNLTARIALHALGIAVEKDRQGDSGGSCSEDDSSCSSCSSKGGSAVSLLNTIVYGIAPSQLGAGWHVDAPSFRQVDAIPTATSSRVHGGRCARAAEREAKPPSAGGTASERRAEARAIAAAARELASPSCAPLAVSVWVALQDIREAQDGGGLHLVSRAALRAAGRASGGHVCVADPETGRPTTSSAAARNGGGPAAGSRSVAANASSCRELLASLSVSPTPLIRAGDAFLFAPDCWHRTSVARPAAALRLRWAYVERWALSHASFHPGGLGSGVGRERTPQREEREPAASAQGEDEIGSCARTQASEPRGERGGGVGALSVPRWPEWALSGALSFSNALGRLRPDFLADFPMQPPCAHGLRDGDWLAASPCFPKVAAADLAAMGGRGGEDEPLLDAASAQRARDAMPIWGTGPLARSVLMFAHRLQPRVLGRALRSWMPYFCWTQLLELPVYALFASRPAELPAYLLAGGTASLISHPAAYSLSFSTRWLLERAAPAWRGTAAWARWLALEVAVVAVEARWMLRAREADRRRAAWPSAIAANVASVVGGCLILRMAMSEKTAAPAA